MDDISYFIILDIFYKYANHKVFRYRGCHRESTQTIFKRSFKQIADTDIAEK